MAMGNSPQIFDLEHLLNLLAAFVPKLLAAGIVLLAFWGIYRATRGSLWAILRRAGIHETLIRMLVDNVYHFALFVFAAVMAASQLDIKIGAALAGLGVAGIALGFAAQDSLANVIAGFLIFWDKPFLVGDFVTVTGQYGMVSEITMRTTRIRTDDNTYVVIPNRKIIDETLVNHSKHGWTRINVPLSIAYEESIPEARKVILAAIKEIDGIIAIPAADVVVKELGASGVNLLVRVSIREAGDEGPLFHRIIETCKCALDQAGIQIPYPHLTLVVNGEEEDAGASPEPAQIRALPKAAALRGGQATRRAA
jgi:small conductance mechanosensitive channel